MANITDNISWDNVYQLEQTDVVLGGAGNISNQQAQQLANRTAWLKNAMRGFNDFTFLQASKTLTADDVTQKIVIINGNGTSQTYNLPLDDFQAGTSITIMAYNVTKQVTINSQGTNDIVLAGVFRQRLFLGDGETISLVWTGDHWFLYSHDTQILSVGLPIYGYSVKPNTVIANGQVLNRADYPRLWEYVQSIGGSLIDDFTWNNTTGRKGFFSTGNNATTFRVPDLRSMFIRGLDLGAGIDFGRLNENAGGYELDTTKEHAHFTAVDQTLNIAAHPVEAGRAISAIRSLIRYFFKSDSGGRESYELAGSETDNQQPTLSPTSKTGGNETRPKNIGLIPLINV